MPFRYPRPLLVLLLLAFFLPLHVAAKGSPVHRPIVVLDPGHGGYGPDEKYIGAVDASGTLAEKDLTLRVAKQAAKILQGYGYRVYLTRTKDQAVNWPPRDLNGDHHIDQLDDYDARTLFANRHHADVLVSIHFDGAADAPELHGTHGYYCPARPFWSKSKRLAGILTAAVSTSLTKAGYASPDNGIETDVADKVPQRFPDYPWFFVLGPSWPKRITGSQMPGSLIESLYLSSPRDAAALQRPAIVAAIARGYAGGIGTYLRSQSRG